MYRRSSTWRSYQRGNWKVGSRHQKHQMMNPAPFLYRFAGPRGPGPYTMKYWWTLGCMPSGKEVPFRLPEFLAMYQQQHVPEEVEDWLDTFVANPAESLSDALNNLLSAMDDVPEMEMAEGYTALEPSIASLSKPLKEVERCLSISIPRTAVRAVMATPRLRRKAMDELYELRSEVEERGSTAHRRLGFDVLTRKERNDGQLAEAIPQGKGLFASIACSLATTPPPPAIVAAAEDDAAGVALTDPQRELVQYAAGSVPDHTATDERLLVRFVTTIAEGSMQRKKYDDAASLLSSMLLFAHDDEVRAELCGCIASAHNRNGTFQEAEFYGRQAALLQRCRRGYANWATAVAYQDDYERAEQIIQDALVQHEADPMLLAVQEALKQEAAKSREVKRDAVAHIPLHTPRAHTDAQRQRGLETGSGRSFMNEFDHVVFNQKLYPAKMDPTSGEMGSVFRRVGNVDHMITSTKSMEQF